MMKLNTFEAIHKNKNKKLFLKY